MYASLYEQHVSVSVSLFHFQIDNITLPPTFHNLVIDLFKYRKIQYQSQNKQTNTKHIYVHVAEHHYAFIQTLIYRSFTYIIYIYIY